MSRSRARIYSQCGLRLCTDLDLPLSTADGDGWDVDVRWGPDLSGSTGQPRGEIIAGYHLGGIRWYTAVATEAGFILRFHGCADFVVSSDVSTVEIRRDPAGDPGLIPILVAGTVSAFLLTLHKHTVLHASAVAVAGSALAIIGHSGRGKSTVAALMCANGAHLISDDVLKLTAGPIITCTGGALELRLRQTAAGIPPGSGIDHPTTTDGRTAYRPRAAATDRMHLRGIVIPTPSRAVSELTVEQLDPGRALLAMLSFPRVQGWRRPDILERDFRTLSQVANSIAVFNATIPWGPPFGPEVARELTQLLSGISISAGDR